MQLERGYLLCIIPTCCHCRKGTTLNEISGASKPSVPDTSISQPKLISRSTDEQEWQIPKPLPDWIKKLLCEWSDCSQKFRTIKSQAVRANFYSTEITNQEATEICQICVDSTQDDGKYIQERLASHRKGKSQSLVAVYRLSQLSIMRPRR
jgi:hypothetical protein